MGALVLGHLFLHLLHLIFQLSHMVLQVLVGAFQLLVFVKRQTCLDLALLQKVGQVERFILHILEVLALTVKFELALFVLGSDGIRFLLQLLDLSLQSHLGLHRFALFRGQLLDFCAQFLGQHADSLLVQLLLFHGRQVRVIDQRFVNFRFQLLLKLPDLQVSIPQLLPERV